MGVGGVEAEAVRGVGGSSVEDKEVGIVEAAKDQVQVAVAIDVGDAGTVRPVGGQDPSWISGETLGSIVQQIGARIAVDGVFRRVGKDDVDEAVVVEIAAEGLDGAPAGQLLPSFGGESVSLAEVDVGIDVTEAVAAEVVDEDHVRHGVGAGAGQQYAAGILAGKPDRLGVDAGARGAVDERVGAVGVGGMGLAENDVGAAVPGQVGDGDIASLVAVEGRAAGLVEPVRAAPVDPGTFSLIVEIAAGENQVDVTVAVQVANGHGHGMGAEELQGRA